ncbi:MAG: hypothetical protein STSR0001_12350 [Methanothrix sp.]
MPGYDVKGLRFAVDKSRAYNTKQIQYLHDEAQDYHHRPQGACDGKNQVVDIVIDGKESQVEAFKEYAETKKRSGAEVSSITISDYDGDVMRMAEYSQVLTAMQMLKAIPTMLEIRDSTCGIDETTRRTEEKIGI